MFSASHVFSNSIRPLLMGKRFLARLLSGCMWLVILMAFVHPGFGFTQAEYVENTPSPNSLTIVQGDTVADVFVDSNDYPGVVRVVHDLQADINRVTHVMPNIVQDKAMLGANAILVGTIGKSAVIDQLIEEGKLDVASVAGKWESSLIQVVSKPLAGVERALVIAGSDKRGTIYGVYDLSEQIGVSPWYWWADVPVKHQNALFVKAGIRTLGPPAVQYRGIFINDEEPALGPWSREKFGGINSKMYAHMFELILRLRGNFLWPAMWGKSIYEDDPESARLADEYGIVLGTSHHEPMTRAHVDWSRNKSDFGNGEWNYVTNEEGLRRFWADGIERNKDHETLITLGMRGDGDEPMSETESVALLERIVADQRKLIGKILNPDVEQVPQVWALYKEVQGYYERGMRAPDDVTLLWCDDNWGNIRRLPTEIERDRSGGAGVYYHFDYVGGPRNYKWLNVTPISKVWEQMNLAYHYGANKIWVVNVGDLKPMEFPIEFFLTMAWDPEVWPKERITEYSRLWAAREFGPQYAADIADIIAKYTKYNRRRTPELLEPGTFSLVNYQEADRVVADWKAITKKAEAIARRLPEEAQDAFFQLVLHPAKACYIVNDLYVTAARNKLYARQGRASANELAERAHMLFKADQELTDYYHHELADGTWNHMMAQNHIGYTYWQQPSANNMPEVEEIELPEAAAMGVAIEGSIMAWPGAEGEAVLPGFDRFSQSRHYVDIFNKGQASFKFAATASHPWIVLSAGTGSIETEERLWVTVDWSKVPHGKAEGTIRISGAGADPVIVQVAAFNPPQPTRESLKGFVEVDGCVSIEAEHYTQKTDTPSVRWERIEDYGRTLSGMSLFPVTAASINPPVDAPCLEYQMYLFTTGAVEVATMIGPALNFDPERGVRLAVSVDDETPQVLTAVPKGYFVDNGNRDWEESVRTSSRVLKSTHTLTEPGYHTLKVWMVDPAVVLEKLVVDTGGVRPSYLGPPETFYNIKSIAAKR